MKERKGNDLKIKKLIIFLSIIYLFHNLFYFNYNNNII